MVDEFKGFVGFFRGVFSESTGEPSFSRIASGVLTGFSCGWITAIVHFTHAIPDIMTLSGLGGLILVPYGTNKITDLLKKG